MLPLSLLFSVIAAQPWCTDFVLPFEAVDWPTGQSFNGLSYDNDGFLHN